MVFAQIFNFARSRATASDTAEAGMSDYLPTAPVEPVTLPPHDPANPPTSWQQDPRIIRDTQPQARRVFEFIDSLSNDVTAASNAQEKAYADPATTVVPADRTRARGAVDTDPLIEKTQKREANASPAPVVTPPPHPPIPKTPEPPRPPRPPRD